MIAEDIARLTKLAAVARVRAEPTLLDPTGMVRTRASYALDALAMEAAADLALRELARDTELGPAKLTHLRQWAADHRDPAVMQNVALLVDALEDCALAVFAAREQIDRLRNDVDESRASLDSFITAALKAAGPGA